ncbi:hypothetical protein FNV43_RR11478 [Rhamnella rubrinervis]|uniref:Ovate family protein n=1 Tax=Rhamnella rubrinervis TaxID=2594499 RepID=A0A8K0MHA9_9ROSA|nr:hypothetical protein FNV43_RR11478 [Rhamnella rubrinervis]
MATKRFKLKFPSVISNSLQFCRFKNPSSFPVNPRPLIHRLSPTNPKAIDISFPILQAPPPLTPECYPSIKRHVSSSKIKPTAECNSCRCKSRLSAQLLFSDCSSEFADFSACKTSSFAITEKYYIKQKNNEFNKKKKKVKAKAKASVSSTGKSTTTDWFSSDDDESRDCRTLIDCPRTPSDYSSCESSTPSLDTSYEKPNVAEAMRSKKKKISKLRRLKRHPSMDWKGSSSSGTGKTTAKAVVKRQERESAAPRGSVLRRLMGRTVEGKAKESFAVVKKSEDPYEDFKRSMLG